MSQQLGVAHGQSGSGPPGGGGAPLDAASDGTADVSSRLIQTEAEFGGELSDVGVCPGQADALGQSVTPILSGDTLRASSRTDDAPSNFVEAFAFNRRDASMARATTAVNNGNRDGLKTKQLDVANQTPAATPSADELELALAHYEGYLPTDAQVFCHPCDSQALFSDKANGFLPEVEDVLSSWCCHVTLLFALGRWSV